MELRSATSACTDLENAELGLCDGQHAYKVAETEGNGFVNLSQDIVAHRQIKGIDLPPHPPRGFTNRTSLMGFIFTFIHGILTFWVLFILSLYFQGVLWSSPERSGVQLCRAPKSNVGCFSSC